MCWTSLLFILWVTLHVRRQLDVGTKSIKLEWQIFPVGQSSLDPFLNCNKSPWSFNWMWRGPIAPDKDSQVRWANTLHLHESHTYYEPSLLPHLFWRNKCEQVILSIRRKWFNFCVTVIWLSLSETGEKIKTHRECPHHECNILGLGWLDQCVTSAPKNGTLTLCFFSCFSLFIHLYP